MATLVHHRSTKHIAVNTTNIYINRQNELFRELEILLDLKPSSITSSLLSLPRKLRDHIFSYVVPDTTHHPPELHTCFWGSDMVNGEPWRHEIFGYAESVPKHHRLPPNLLLFNKQLREEVLENYFRNANLTLHAELRNTRYQNGHFDYSPHIPQLPMLKYVTNVRFYVEWNYTTEKNVVKERRRKDQIRMTESLLRAMDRIIAPLRSISSIELSVLFFWKYRSGKVYSMTMSDLFELEDTFKRCAEKRWLMLLRRRDSSSAAITTTTTATARAPSDQTKTSSRSSSSSSPSSSSTTPSSKNPSRSRTSSSSTTVSNKFNGAPATFLPTHSTSPSPSAGVGYKLSSEKKGTEQSGGMQVFVSQDLEDAMKARRKSSVDFYGHYGIAEPLPQPGYRVGAMI